MKARPLRLAIAGIHIESSTFSPLPTRVKDFMATRGEGMLERYPFLTDREFAAIVPVPLAHFRALPGGPVAREDYEAMKGEILERLEKCGEIDAFYFDIHGAMAVAGLDDAEADLLASIRERIGPHLPVTCSQDLHGNVSDKLVSMVHFLTTYRTAPHIDWMETRERAVRLLLRWWNDPKPVFRARVGIPVLVSGEMSSTTTEPGKSLYAPLRDESELPGVWDGSLWVGYAWADQERSMASAVVTGTDREAVCVLAEAIASRYWQARHEFRFVAPSGTADECLHDALQLQQRAVFLSDAGDNPTAGAVGDVPATLARLTAHPAFSNDGPASAIFASIPDATAIEACFTAGVGHPVHVSLGGKLDPIHGTPLDVEGIVMKLTEGDSFAGRQAVMRAGKVDIIITEHRKPFHRRDDFLQLGLDPLECTVTVVKIGYLEPELRAMASHHFLVLSPGAVPPDLTRIDYRNLKRPVFPLDQDFTWEPQARVWESISSL